MAYSHCNVSESYGAIKWQVSGNTDIGGSHENQDDMFIFEKKELGICIIGVLDGHGRDFGKLAAVSARLFLLSFFEKYYHELFTTPYECLVRAHLEAHLAIREAFKAALDAQGWDIMEKKEYLLKKKRGLTISTGSSPSVKCGWQCVHGGTSCSIVALVRDCVYVANVGDSSATMGAANYLAPLVEYNTSTSPSMEIVLLNADSDVLYIGDSDVHSVINKLKQEEAEMDGSGYGSQYMDVDMAASSMSNSSVDTVMTNSAFSIASCGSSTSTATISYNTMNYTQQHQLSTNPISTSSSASELSTATIFGNMTSIQSYNKFGSLSGKTREVLKRTSFTSVTQSTASMCKSGNTSTLMITAEHSPESVNEYIRLYTCCPAVNTSRLTINTLGTPSLTSTLDPMTPSLLVVYDQSNCMDKSRCPNIFTTDPHTQELRVTNNGRYYKNVRKEWASLVSTPANSKFHDALAFTRSLGDFHLHSFGVSEYPEVHRIDVHAILHRQLQQCTKRGTHKVIPVLGIVLATDGVWDNWKYEDVTQFIMDLSCINAVLTPTQPFTGIQRVSASFLHRNMIYSKHNFGNQADNATCVILLMSTAPEFPA